MITQKYLKSILHYDSETGIFIRIKITNRKQKIGEICGTLMNRGYISIKIDKKSYLSHRLAWFYVYGKWPKNNIDHINNNKLDNRICNLRDIPQSLNVQNLKKSYSNNKTGLLGVCKQKNSSKWRAEIRINYEKIFLGLFETAELAHEAYLTAKNQIHKGYAK